MKFVKQEGQREQAAVVDPLMCAEEVEAATKLGRTVRTAKIKKGTFPAPTKQRDEHGDWGRTNYWKSSEIQAYIDGEVAAYRAHTEKVAAEGLNGWLNNAVQRARGMRSAATRPPDKQDLHADSTSTQPPCSAGG